MVLDIQRAGTVRLGPADERDIVYEERKKRGCKIALYVSVHNLRSGY